MLLNIDRAREVMARRGLDGLVAQTSINVYYLSDYWGMLMNAERFDATFFAVLPRREDASPVLILPAVELRRLVTKGGTWIPEIVSYTSPLDDETEGLSGAGKPYTGWPVREGAELTDRESAWIEMTRRHGDSMAPDAIAALERALRIAGLEAGKVGTDDARLASWIEDAGFSGLESTYDTNVFNEIRRVKTPDEIDLMRTAARINEIALRAAGDAMHEGAEWSEMERVYFTSMASQGGAGSYFICGVGELPSGRIRRGEPMLFDALGTYHQYHGDFGRCAVVGEPSAEMRTRHAALVAGWDAVQPLLRPGVTYSKIADTAVAAIHSAGFPEFVYATPHGLGLEHTDDPKPVGLALGSGWDTTIESGMVLNVDLPYTEIGWGSVHIEDTIVITDDGFEALTTQDLDILKAP